MKLFEPDSLIIILVIVLIIFGPKQLPELGKTLGKTMKAIRDGGEDGKAASTDSKGAAASQSDQPSVES